jgi:hypothetical protein
MSTKTSTSPISVLIGQFGLQQKLFTNAVKGIKNEDSHKRMNQNTNHLAWLVGHLVSTRYMMVNVLGGSMQEPFPELFAQGKGSQPDVKYPPLEDLTRDWDKVSEKLNERLNSLTEADLGANAPFPTPLGGTVKDFIAFCAHHEAYTIGQLGLYRRFHGHDA